MALMALCIGTTAFAVGDNPLVTLPLAYKASGFEPCTISPTVDCEGLRPLTEAAPGAPACIWQLVYNHNSVAGIQTAYSWGAWVLTFGLWDCQPMQLSAVTPANPGGATAGTITTAWTCVNSPALLVAGRMFFQNVNTGCITQVQSTFPDGINVLDCSGDIDLVTEQARLGSVCVGSAGTDACDPVSAVEPATWGSIKGQYN
jgi:hypothetical protein